MREKTIILGAAGRDFHNFNMVYRNNPSCKVVAFTATQIPNIENRVYPAKLAGSFYPKGIPIVPETELERIIQEHEIEQAIFSYSDVSHEDVMHLASRVLTAGAAFQLLSPQKTMIRAKKPVVAVTATRTGTGKSQVSRSIARYLRNAGKQGIAVRHPMPYGRDLLKQRIERFATRQDFDRFECTIEEREEYEAYIEEGLIIYAGVDYEAIVHRAEEEADILIWDGGNNDLPFLQPDLWITVADPFRVGHELKYHPGEVNFRAAQVILINKANSAPAEHVEVLRQHAKQYNPKAQVVVASSALHTRDPEQIRGKRVLCIEDGPTLTHGGMSFGAGYLAAETWGASAIIDPRPYAVGTLADTFHKYPHIGKILPAMGYFPDQLQDLQQTIRNTPCDLVLVATPIDLAGLIDLSHPSLRIRYELEDRESPRLKDILDGWMGQLESQKTHHP